MAASIVDGTAAAVSSSDPGPEPAAVSSSCSGDGYVDDVVAGLAGVLVGSLPYLARWAWVGATLLWRRLRRQEQEQEDGQEQEMQVKQYV